MELRWDIKVAPKGNITIRTMDGWWSRDSAMWFLTAILSGSQLCTSVRYRTTHSYYTQLAHMAGWRAGRVTSSNSSPHWMCPFDAIDQSINSPTHASRPALWLLSAGCGGAANKGSDLARRSKPKVLRSCTSVKREGSRMHDADAGAWPVVVRSR